MAEGALPPPYTGGCFCGAVRYRLSAAPKAPRSCHCSQCRKAFSAQASAYALVDPDDFVWTAGEHLLTDYVGRHGAGKRFCRICGSTLCGIVDGVVHGITLGCLDQQPELDDLVHIFVGSKAVWERLPDGVRCFAAAPDDGTIL